MYGKGPQDKLLISAQVLNFQLILLHDYSLKTEGMKTKHLLTLKETTSLSPFLGDGDGNPNSSSSPVSSQQPYHTPGFTSAFVYRRAGSISSHPAYPQIGTLEMAVKLILVISQVSVV